MEFLTEQKRTVEDDLVFEIPYSRFLTMNELANPITLIEAPGPTEMIDILSMTWTDHPSNEIALSQEMGGGLKTCFGDNSNAQAAEDIGINDVVNLGYYYNKIVISDNARPAKVDALNKPIKLFYSGVLEDNGAEGTLKVQISYRIVEVGSNVI